ncbi:MAG: ParA family protein [Agarilytica sp.]
MIRVVFNQKGGVGKTSITCNLAAIAAKNGKRTVVVDLDPQFNASHYLLGDVEVEDSIVDYLDQTGGMFGAQKKATEFVYETPHENLYVLPSSPKLPEIEHKLESRYKIYKLRDALQELEQDYDEIYIDTPPAFNFFTKSALIGCKRVLIPFDCDAFSRQSLDKVSDAIFDICEDHNPELMIEGVIVNQFQARAKLPQQLIDDIHQAGYPVLPIKLCSSVKMRESHQVSKPLIFFAPKHNLTQQFVDLVRVLDGEQPKVSEEKKDTAAV